jgi:hypothetical protein
MTEQEAYNQMTEQERKDFINGIVNGVVDDLTAPEIVIEDLEYQNLGEIELD